MAIGSSDAQFWLKTANEARVTAETIGDADSAARGALLAIAAEYEAIAKRAYNDERASTETTGTARASSRPRQP